MERTTFNGTHLIGTIAEVWSVSPSFLRTIHGLYTNLPSDYLRVVSEKRTENRRSGNDYTAKSSEPANENQPFADKVDANGVLYLNLSGPLVPTQTSYSYYFDSGEIAMDKLEQVLSLAKSSNAVKALSIVINCPGGASIQSRNLADFLANIGKPVFAYIDGQATSAGYDLIASANKIFASPSNITGSIGTMTTIVNDEPGNREVGIYTYSFASGSMKLVGMHDNETGELSDASKNSLQDFVSKLGSDFVNKVVKRRGLNTSQREDISKADIYVNAESVSSGLVDELASKEKYYSEIKQMVGGKKAIPQRKYQNSKETDMADELHTLGDNELELDLVPDEEQKVANSTEDFVVSDEMRNLLKTKNVKSINDLNSLFSLAEIGTAARNNMVQLCQKYSSMANDKECKDTFDDLSYDRLVQMASALRSQCVSSGLIPQNTRGTIDNESVPENGTEKKPLPVNAVQTGKNLSEKIELGNALLSLLQK